MFQQVLFFIPLIGALTVKQKHMYNMYIMCYWHTHVLFCISMCSFNSCFKETLASLIQGIECMFTNNNSVPHTNRNIRLRKLFNIHVPFISEGIIHLATGNFSATCMWNHKGKRNKSVIVLFSCGRVNHCTIPRPTPLQLSRGQSVVKPWCYLVWWPLQI